MMIVLRNGRIIDPARGVDRVGDLILDKGRIVSDAESANTVNIKVADCTGMWVMPGFIDLRAHLGEPGLEDRDTMETSLASAARGGYTVVAGHPGTEPCCDNRATCQYLRQRGQEVGGPLVLPTGALTRGMKGERLSDLGEMAESGVTMAGDTDFCVADASTMRHAMEYSLHFGLRIQSFPVDKSLWGGALLREGFSGTRLGLPGMPGMTETAPLMRDLMLAATTGAPLHVARISGKESLEWLKIFKSRYDVDVTVDVTPYHLYFCDEDLETYRSSLHFRPPLGSREDLRALRRALRDGVIDAVASDHMPRNLVDKMVELDQSAPGCVGFETTAAALSTLVAADMLSPTRMTEALSTSPARILGLKDRGSLAPGFVADVTVMDPAAVWTVDAQQFATRSTVTPFAGREFTGRVVMTIAQGKVLHDQR